MGMRELTSYSPSVVNDWFEIPAYGIDPSIPVGADRFALRVLDNQVTSGHQGLQAHDKVKRPSPQPLSIKAQQ
jgi:hypothetical protein